MNRTVKIFLQIVIIVVNRILGLAKRWRYFKSPQNITQHKALLFYPLPPTFFFWEVDYVLHQLATGIDLCHTRELASKHQGKLDILGHSFSLLILGHWSFICSALDNMDVTWCQMGKINDKQKSQSFLTTISSTYE